GETSWVEGDCEEISSAECPAGFVRPPLIMVSVDGFRASYLKKGPSVIPNIHKLRTSAARVHVRVHAPAPPSSLTGLCCCRRNLWDVSAVHAPRLPVQDLPQLVHAGHGALPGVSRHRGQHHARPRLQRHLQPAHQREAEPPLVGRAADLDHSGGAGRESRNLLLALAVRIRRPLGAARHFGHRLGPLSSELDNPLRELDNVIGQLMNGLKQMHLHRCVNVIVVGDHGMEEAHCDWTEFLSNYPVNIEEISLIPGSLGRIRAREPRSSTYDPKAVVANLTCKRPGQHFRPYLKQHLPKRLHYANNRRIEDVQLLMDRKWHIARKAPEKPRSRCGFFGDHGFDNMLGSMRTIFMGHGPSFKFKTSVPEFENIELYNVMCDLLGLKPAPNNGTHGSLDHMLRAPPLRPGTPQEVTPPSPTSSQDPAVLPRLGCKQNRTHLPFGRPAVMFDTQYSLLRHVEFISGYSKELAVPLWTAYTLPKQEDWTPVPEVSPACVRADPRVSADHSQSCSAYSQHPQLSYGFLFPPGKAAARRAVLSCGWTSASPPPAGLWRHLQGALLRRYAKDSGGINVLAGPVFDNNYDGLRDSADQIKEWSGGSLLVPTHFYTVVTSCQEVNRSVEDCGGALGVFSFLIPHRADNSEACNVSGPAGGASKNQEKGRRPSFRAQTLPLFPVHAQSAEDESEWVEELLKRHTARVRDVEILTGLDLYRSTNLTYVSTLSLKTRLHTFQSDD
ncbi:unnamed protein product, partial [Tetraodon nigroviridis]